MFLRGFISVMCIKNAVNHVVVQHSFTTFYKPRIITATSVVTYSMVYCNKCGVETIV